MVNAVSMIKGDWLCFAKSPFSCTRPPVPLGSGTGGHPVDLYLRSHEKSWIKCPAINSTCVYQAAANESHSIIYFPLSMHLCTQTICLQWPLALCFSLSSYVPRVVIIMDQEKSILGPRIKMTFCVCIQVCFAHFIGWCPDCYRINSNLPRSHPWHNNRAMCVYTWYTAQGAHSQIPQLLQRLGVSTVERSRFTDVL